MIRRLVFPLILLIAGGLVWLVGWSSVLTVSDVEVQAPASVSAEAVRIAVGDLHGVPLARVDVADIKSRIERIPSVASATVTRSWPRTLAVSVVARVPVVALRSSTGVSLVDASGAVIASVAVAPKGLPLLRTTSGQSVSADLHTPATSAALSVAAVLPADLRPKVLIVAAVGPEDVRLTLLGGSQVRWGGVGDAGLKATVLRALLAHPARVYDVSAPLLPTTRS